MINNIVIGTADTDVLVVPTGKNYAQNLLIFCNTSATAADTLTVHVIKSGDTKQAKNMIINARPIPAKDTFEFDVEKLLLSAGDKIIALSTNGTVSATVSYIEI